MRKKLIALIIVIITLICCIGITAFAEDAEGEQPVIPQEEQAPETPAEEPQPTAPPAEETPQPTEEPQPTAPPTEEPQPTAPPTETPTEAPVIIPTPTPVPAVPYVYKDPSAEVVKSGEGCIFVAKAENHTAINWYFTKNNKIVYAAEAERQFPGLKVSGDGTEILSLESVPESIDGWSVGALFSNAYGRQGTGTCTITVTAPASPSPAATTSPKPTVSPSPSVKTTAAPMPAVTPMITGTTLISPSPEIEPEKTEHGGFPFGKLLIGVLVLAILATLTALFVLNRRSGSKRKGKTIKAVIENIRNDDDFEFDLEDNKKEYRGKH